MANLRSMNLAASWSKNMIYDSSMEICFIIMMIYQLLDYSQTSHGKFLSSHW